MMMVVMMMLPMQQEMGMAMVMMPLRRMTGIVIECYYYGIWWRTWLGRMI
jgi:hypothetical protein